jgi:hypothetical protein
MMVIENLTNLLNYPLYYPVWWLLGSWIIWVFLKWTSWPRPTLSMMLLYSISVAIEFVESVRELEACFAIELCASTFSLLWL